MAVPTSDTPSEGKTVLLRIVVLAMLASLTLSLGVSVWSLESNDVASRETAPAEPTTHTVPPNPPPSLQPSPAPSTTPLPTALPLADRLVRLCASNAKVEPQPAAWKRESLTDRYPGTRAIIVNDRNHGQIDFCLRRPDHSLLSTESAVHPNWPTKVTFYMPDELPKIAQRVWLLINAGNTTQEMQDQIVGAVVVTFKSDPPYTQEFDLKIGLDLSDWRVEANTLFEPDLKSQVVLSGTISIDNKQSQLVAVPFDIENADPIATIAVEDRSSRLNNNPDPSLELVAATLIQPEHLDALKPSSGPKTTEGQRYLCLADYVDTSRFINNLWVSKVLKQDKNLGFSRTCATTTTLALQASAPLTMTLPINGSVLETRPTIAAINENGETIVSTINLDLATVEPVPVRASMINLVVAARNLCYLHDKYKLTVAYVTVRFEGGYRLSALPLKAGQTLRQARDVGTCANTAVYDIDERRGTNGLSVSKGSQVNPADGNSDSARTPFWLDVISIEIPPALQNQPITAIEIVDESLQDREGIKRNDPYISLFAVTLITWE